MRKEEEQNLLEILKMLIESLSEGLIMVELDGRIRYANQSALEILELDIENAVGKTFADLFFYHPENDDFSQIFLDTIYAHRGIEPRIVSIHTKNKIRQLRVASAYIPEKKAKNKAGIFLVLSDLSGLIELKDAVKAMDRINTLNRKLNARNNLLNRTFGQFLSDDIVKELLKTPGALQPGGKKMHVAVMMSDLRGFTALSERMDAVDLLIMLNHYLEKMTDIIQGHHGTIIEFLGDGILAVFGAPVQLTEPEEHAVAAALQMQDAMDEINFWNIKQGYPLLEMGIGLTSGETVVGIIGSEKRKKYGVIGSRVNKCGRIESYTTGGQLLISSDVKRDIQVPITIEKEMTVTPKGVNSEMVLSQVTGIGEPYNIHVSMKNRRPGKLDAPVPVCFFRLSEKHVLKETLYGGITAVGEDCAMLETQSELEVLDNLQIDMGDRLLCKVVEKTEEGFLLQYTSIPSGYSRWLKEHGIRT